MDFARHLLVSARKFVVIRTSRCLFSYTNFEPATALRVTNHRPQKDLNKKYTVLVYFLFKLVAGDGFEPPTFRL